MDIQFYHEESPSLYISKVRKETFVTSLYDLSLYVSLVQPDCLFHPSFERNKAWVNTRTKIN